jgi:hypothetical protein
MRSTSLSASPLYEPSQSTSGRGYDVRAEACVYDGHESTTPGSRLVRVHRRRATVSRNASDGDEAAVTVAHDSTPGRRRPRGRIDQGTGRHTQVSAHQTMPSVFKTSRGPDS